MARKLTKEEKELVFSDTLIILLPSLFIGYSLEILLSLNGFDDLGLFAFTDNPFLFFLPAIFVSFYKIYLLSAHAYDKKFIKNRLFESKKLGKKTTIVTWILFALTFTFQHFI